MLAAHETIYPQVRRGATRAITGLENTLVALHLSVLAAEPWTALA
jgi:hypothetical protein